MSFALRSGRKCVICAFRAADSRLLALSPLPGRHRSLHGDGPESRADDGRDKRIAPKQAASRRDRYPIRRPLGLSGTPVIRRTKVPKKYIDPTLVQSVWRRLIGGLRQTTFAPRNARDDVPLLGEIAGLRTEEEFQEKADEFWLQQLQPALQTHSDSHLSAFRRPLLHPLGDTPLRVNAAKAAKEKHMYNKIVEPLSAGKEPSPRDVDAVQDVLKSLFIGYINASSLSPEQVSHAKAFADFRYPIEWYPGARALQRKIHLHVGPTNSGKTYHALKRLEQAETGVYAGPLRLLAHEVYSRMNAAGKVCALITGEERRIPEGYRGQMSSCTVEMVPLNLLVDVAVIDEIQMVADRDRGWAWTQALLGVQAKEVHLCGEVRTIELIQKLCKLMGDELIIHNYERLTPLECMGKSFGGNFKKLQKGDAVVVFSRVGIHAMKKQIEAETGKRCAVIYGSLPPETRAQQAALFNDQENDYDYLVASDAVGMGLNLAIRRVIFESTVKYNGKGGYNKLSVSELKQIAGRAGRYKTAAEGMQDSKNHGTREDGTPRHPPRNVGLATTLDPNDHSVLKAAMETDVEMIKSCGMFPPTWAYRRFAAYFPHGTPFGHVVSRMNEVAVIDPMFFLCAQDDQLRVADAIEAFDLRIEDRLIFMASPADMRRAPEILIAFASHVAAQSSAELYNIKELELELLDVKIEGKNYLQRLERLHGALTLYLWLSYRFAGVFISQPLAFYVKGLVEERIDHALAEVGTLSKAEQARRRAFKHQKLLEMKEEEERMAREMEIEERDAPSPYSKETEDAQEPLMDPLEEAEMEGKDVEEILKSEKDVVVEKKDRVVEEENDDDENDDQDLAGGYIIEESPQDENSQEQKST